MPNAVTMQAFAACKEPATTAPLSCYTMKDLVEINVRDVKNSTQKAYTLPRELLRWHSSYFAAALDPKSQLQGVDKVKYPLEERHEVFEIFLCWLWTGRLRDALKADEDPHLSEVVLFELWIFADMRGIPALGNAAIDALLERLVAKGQQVPLTLICKVYESTTSGALIRKYFVDTFVLTQLPAWWMTLDADTLPFKFVLEALPKLLTRGVNAQRMHLTAWKQHDRCQWHDHSGPGGKLRLESRE
ncbi:hypothetical protein ACEQ8H_008381 [Pleosporales sp. CAS-2024a]